MSLENDVPVVADYTGERKYEKIRYIVLGSVSGLAVLVMLFALKLQQGNDFVSQVQRNSSPDVPVESVVEDTVELVASVLDGEWIPPEVSARRPIGVMVENHRAARPHAGLIDADIVYEVPVEADITRFFAIYQQHEPERVGPERSARVYFLDWVKEYRAVYAHIGQDPAVLGLISLYRVDDLRDFGAVWDPPGSGRSTEHRAYTSIPALRGAMADKGWEYPIEDFVSWAFEDEELAAELRPVGGRIELNYGGTDYNSEWVYDSAANVYRHLYGGVDHMDASNNTQISAKNVIVMELQVWQRKGDTKGRKDMKVDGEGKVTVFRDGGVTEGRWVKADREGRTQFLDVDGQPITLNRGQIWVHVIPAFSEQLSFERGVLPGDAIPAEEPQGIEQP